MKPVLLLLTILLTGCGPADQASSGMAHKKDTACRRPESRADQDAQQAIREAELQKNEKMKKETN